MDNFDKEKVYASTPAGYKCLILVSDEGTSIVENNKLKWNREIYEGGFYEDYLTLEEISAQLKTLGFEGVFYVWIEKPLNGAIYQFGNYSDVDYWIKHGTTNGYA